MQHYTYLVGNVGSDLRFGTASNGSPWASFRLAVSDSYRTEDGSFRDRPPTWYDVKVWRSWAHNLVGSIAKGQRVIVVGKVYMDPWESDSGSGERLTMQAHAVGPDLVFGRTVFRSTKPSNDEEQQFAGAERMAASASTPGTSAIASPENPYELSSTGTSVSSAGGSGNDNSNRWYSRSNSDSTGSSDADIDSEGEPQLAGASASDDGAPF